MLENLKIKICDHHLEADFGDKVVWIRGEPTITGFVALSTSIETWKKPKNAKISADEKAEIIKAVTDKTRGTRWEVWFIE